MIELNMTETKQAPRGIEICELMIRVHPDHLPGFKRKHLDYTYREMATDNGDDFWFLSNDRRLITKVCREEWEFSQARSVTNINETWKGSKDVRYYLHPILETLAQLYTDDPDFTKEMLDVWDWNQDYGSYLIAKDGTLRHPDYFWLLPPYDTATQLQALVLLGYSQPLNGKPPITSDTAIGRRWIKARREAIG